MGDSDPKKLSNTLLFLIGLNMALHAGSEHKALCRPGCDPQIVVVKDGDVEYLHYTEDLCTKTNQGGLDHQQVPPKEVQVGNG